MGLGNTPPVALGFPDNDPDFEHSMRLRGVDCALRFWKGCVQEGREETAAYVRIQVDPISPSIEREEGELQSLRDTALQLFQKKDFTATTHAPIRGTQQSVSEDPHTFYILPSRSLPSQNSQELFDSVMRALESGFSSSDSGSSLRSGSPARSQREPGALWDAHASKGEDALEQFVEEAGQKLRRELGDPLPSSVTAALYRLGQAMLPRDHLRSSLGPDSTDICDAVERCQELVLEPFKGEKVPTGPLAHLTVALERAILERKQAGRKKP